ncbi:hypothetical protein BaRGS_00014228 [Batillaria attramentaria]|uniref:Uncharacterized protein n=1 Tax=Batillaria attramentaria TaxID=370345 RepID=A0ABD0L5Z0_9CAEN
MYKQFSTALEQAFLKTVSLMMEDGPPLPSLTVPKAPRVTRVRKNGKWAKCVNCRYVNLFICPSNRTTTSAGMLFTSWETVHKEVECRHHLMTFTTLAVHGDPRDLCNFVCSSPLRPFLSFSVVISSKTDKPVTFTTMATIKVYVTSVFGSTKLRKQQQTVIDVLESRNIPFERIDISDPNQEEQRKFMRANSKPRKEGQAPLPPQIFHDDEYCGDCESLTNSIETDTLYDFLKLEDPDKDAKARIITEEVEEEKEKQDEVKCGTFPSVLCS